MELAGRSLKGQLKQAERLGARYVAIVGRRRASQLRDMRAGAEETLARDALIDRVAARA